MKHLILCLLLAAGPLARLQAQFTEVQLPGQFSVQAMHFWNASDGIIAGAPGKVLITRDGGHTWKEHPLPVNEWMHEFSFPDSANGYLAGQNGALLRTTDAGRTWTTVTIPIIQDFLALHFINPDTGLVGGALGLLFWTGDGGQTWTDVSFQGMDNAVETLHIRPNGTGIGMGFPASCCGGQAMVIGTANFGQTWKPNFTPMGFPLYDMVFWDDTTILGVGNGGLTLRSSNGGANWTTQNMPAVYATRGLARFADGPAYIVGETGVVARTTDAGASWTSLPTPTTVDLHAIASPDSGVVYAAGLDGVFLRMGGPTSRAEADAATHAITVFPNPASGYLEIRGLDNTAYSNALFRVISLSTGRELHQTYVHSSRVQLPQNLPRPGLVGWELRASGGAVLGRGKLLLR